MRTKLRLLSLILPIFSSLACGLSPAPVATANLPTAMPVVPTILEIPTIAPTVSAIPAASDTPAIVQQNCTPRGDWPYQYTVVAGDTLSKIAQSIGSTADSLASGNCLVSANVIYAGEILRVPA